MSVPTRPGLLDWDVNRWVPFDETIEIEGVDLSGATMTSQVRLYRDAPGAPLIDLANVSSGQGLSVSVATEAGLPVSTIRMIINETTIEDLLPFPGSGVGPGASVELAWDLILTKAGAFKKARWFEGAFNIIPGSTQT